MWIGAKINEKIEFKKKVVAKIGNNLVNLSELRRTGMIDLVSKVRDLGLRFLIALHSKTFIEPHGNRTASP